MLTLLSVAVGVAGLWAVASGLVMLVGSVGLAVWCWWPSRDSSDC